MQYANPLHWAMTVPRAMPGKPKPSKIPGIPKASKKDARMLMPLTSKSAVMGLTESCMPMNQPLKAKSDSVAGAAQMRM